jgi:hypothetical protein
MKEENNFPTGKRHVSFSEIKCWKECSYRHKLSYIDKVDLFEPSPYLDFGTAIHAGCETLLEKKELDGSKLLKDITDAWDKYGFDDPEWVKNQPGWYKYAPVETWCQWAENMWDEVPKFLDETFPGWEYVAAEEMLYEPIENKDLNFKGYIDGVIKVPNNKGDGHKYWIIDWKTSQSYGWRRSKKQDILMTSQLILYKHFWSRKHSVELKDIRCGFILLKRGGKPGRVCELVTVSVGPKASATATKIMNNMIASVRRGMFLKNRDSCRYCQFKDTEHCT